MALHPKGRWAPSKNVIMPVPRSQKAGSKGWGGPVEPGETGASPLKCHPGVL